MKLSTTLLAFFLLSQQVVAVKAQQQQWSVVPTTHSSNNDKERNLARGGWQRGDENDSKEDDNGRGDRWDNNRVDTNKKEDITEEPSTKKSLRGRGTDDDKTSRDNFKFGRDKEDRDTTQSAMVAGFGRGRVNDSPPSKKGRMSFGKEQEEDDKTTRSRDKFDLGRGRNDDKTKRSFDTNGLHGAWHNDKTDKSHKIGDKVHQLHKDLLGGKHFRKTKNCKATGYGDPHMTTFDGLKYDVHAKGELTFLKSLDSTFEIQARTEAAGNGPGAPAVTTGLVIHEDSALELPTIQVSMALSEDSENAVMINKCPVNLFVDGKAMDITDGTGVRGIDLKVKRDKIFLSYKETKMDITMKVKFYRRCLFSIDYVLRDCRPDDTLVGILGSPDGDESNEWMKRDGTPLEIPKISRSRYFKPSYDYAVKNWCLASDSESYFTYEDGADFAYYDYCGNEYDSTLEDIVTNTDPKIEEICKGDVGCIIDGATLGAEAAEGFNEDLEEFQNLFSSDDTSEDETSSDGTSEDEATSWDMLGGWTSNSHKIGDKVHQLHKDLLGGKHFRKTKNCKATGYGDPHMTTFDGLKYDVHAKGELTFLKSLDSTFEIQARTEAAGNGPGAPAVTTGLVIHEDSALELPTIQVSMALSEDSENAVMINKCPVNLFVDGKAMDITDGTGVKGIDLKVKRDKIFLSYKETKMDITMKVKFYRRCLFSIDYVLRDCRPDDTLVGILGSPDGDETNEWMKRDGTPLEIPKISRSRYFKPSYDYAVKNWCLESDSESYFTYEDGADFAYYDYCGNEYDSTLEDIVTNADPVIEEICNGDVGCIIDGETLGAEAAKGFNEDLEDFQKTADSEDVSEDSDESGEEEPSIGSLRGAVSNRATACRATGYGDPHMTTFDGLKFDVHAKGELTFLKSLNSTFEIQARTEAAGNGPGAPAVTTGLVIHEDSALDLPIIQVSMALSEDSEKAVMINKCPVNLYKETKLDITMKVKFYRRCLFSIDYVLRDCRPDDTLVGILGSPDGDKTNEWMKRDGTPLEIPKISRSRYFKPSYDYAVNNWCLESDSGSYFTYEAGTDFAYYDYCGNEYDSTLEDIVTNTDPDIDAICKGDVGCIIDGETLGAEAAEGFKEDEEEFENPVSSDDMSEDSDDSGDEDKADEPGLKADTVAPSTVPAVRAATDAPTDPPVPEATDAPTDPPVLAATDAPTDPPVLAATDAPTDPPVLAATDAPTDPPVLAATDAPTNAPTDAPVSAPTDAPTDAPTNAPTAAPVPAPTDAPTKSPVTSPPTNPAIEQAAAAAPDSTPGSKGDPHFITWKGEHFEYHGQCDMVLTQDSEFANGLGLDVHIRTKLV
eukprot:scaffold1848_cov111-Cylindrotheca_fusiformis.AAC.3